jgi:hypothetical protein
MTVCALPGAWSFADGPAAALTLPDDVAPACANAVAVDGEVTQVVISR